MTSNLYDFLPILMQVAFSVVFVFAIVFVSNLIGPKRKNARKMANFECGLDPIGDARRPFHIRYFLVAILFVLFDIEIVFMYPWAVNFQELSWEGFGKMGIFIAIIIVGLLYEVKRRALDWEK
ncbi:NADH-quinone oxidoreductase subunit A [Dysgonomonas sp. 511]|uniref:NADH-quinone oxidoreductase subunit A n=1 Tax=Dysgonomonas sp. 511 TaxID=2302930 RepID=UPI0013D120C1|nr:NADH-quinone oxidoreductase subunit A [Dysgonomonas sp. 511]NDV77810.1 NADH-quinone oxidoreductase subunit A [Dysgonomonas sp. 511]